MNAKRLLIPLMLLCTITLLVMGCAPKEEQFETELDDMEILKIETSWHYGLDAFPCEYTRTFDFKHGTVCDTRVTNTPEYIPSAEIDKYNKPKQIATFTEEQAKTLYEKIKALGFLAWKDEYITDDIICDGGSERVVIYFADGTVKSTIIYFEYPKNYEQIRQAFEDNFGVTFYLSW